MSTTSTTVLATDVSTDGTTQTIQLQQGRYLFAISGTFDGATAAFQVNIGPATDCPVAGMSYTESNAEVVWLPNCTAQIAVSGAGGTTNLNAAIARLSLDID